LRVEPGGSPVINTFEVRRSAELPVLDDSEPEWKTPTSIASK